MRASRSIWLTTALALCLTASLPASASAAQQPVWKLNASSQPTNLAPGSKGGGYFLVANNVGSKVTEGEITITDTLPEDLTLNKTNGEPKPRSLSPGAKDPGTFKCETTGQTVTCKGAGTIHPGFWLEVYIPVEVAASPQEIPHVNQSEVSGGGAAPVKASTPTTLSAALPLFDFLPGERGFAAPLYEEDGTPATKAGSRPYATIVDLGFPTRAPSGALIGSGPLRDVKLDLPPGLLANPAATSLRCTEAELTGQFPGCPSEAQVGTVTVKTVLLTEPQAETVPLYNMVTPPGTPAVFGFDVLGVGIFPHVIAKVRTESDYGASGISRDILARGLNPVLDVSTELWGDPSADEHDFVRGRCAEGSAKPPCDTPHQPDAFLSLPVECDKAPLSFTAFADSWEEPFPQFPEREATYESASLEGNPTSVNGCNQLEFKPQIEVTPTTNLAESPSGLEVDLFQPQNTSLKGLSTSSLKDATLTLPLGLEVNAAQADGLAACSPAQVGMLTAVGESPGHFSDEPSTCPDAAKIGKVEVTSPLLAQYDETGRKLQRDPEGKAIPDPLFGSVFLAEPFENPFNSLLAIYLTVEDPKTGIFAKLAGKVEPDPNTGQLTTVFEQNPQLPIEDVKVTLFKGSRAPLQTPPSCGTHTATTQMVPWGAPETPNAAPTGSFATTAAPSGGTCPTAADQAPNSPSFTAGTLSHQAGAFSEFVLKLSREDGTQRFSGLETTLPPGLSGKLAGVAQCSEAQVAQALDRSDPNEGALEQQSPSCPSNSQIGIVDVAAGAGPTPFHVPGRIYLAGPYKGAPLSFLVVTPAIAGPFDLGAVSVRAGLYLDPVTAQVKALSDPLPTIVHGIPVDVRSIAVKVDRPQFTLNPTSCEPMQVTGSLTSVFNQSAALSSPFQVGGCSQLPFKPKLSLRLKGGTKRGAHPRLIAKLTAKPGEANIARTSVQLPKSAFLDQSHIGTVCTRVQFAASQCPKGSIYGKASATTPLLDYALKGNVYLRSSNNPLPDLLIDLRGPEHQPIRIELAGRTDSVKGALRNTFDLVPDAPVSKFELELFGGKRGLVINSRNLCARKYRAKVQMEGQNGKAHDTRPVVKSSCAKSRKSKKRR